MYSIKSKKDVRIRRRKQIRKKIAGTQERPRLAIFRSARHIYAQIIDDTQGITMISASSLDKNLSDELKAIAANSDDKAHKVMAARVVGKEVARKAQEKSIGKVAFDRGGFLYTGRVKALAEAAREAGLVF